MSDRYDVLVVGGGPSGAAAAYWLVQQGRVVLVVETKRFAREKTCGDGLTPRAVRELHDMGLADPLAGYQRYDGLRSIAHGVTLELAWPRHPDFPPYGYVVRRRDLDEMVADQAVKAGATLWQAIEAVAPLVEGGLVVGAMAKRKDSGTTQPVQARYLLVADGANSRFGRLPMGNSVEPAAGPTWLVCGDAGGSINPFNGEGIAYAYETGRMAADALDEALRTGDGLALQRYPTRLEETYGLYYRVARVFV